MAEEEKKKHAGDDFEKSIRNVMDAQKSDFSKNFPKSKKLPGIVRSLQEKPFKLMLGNYDQLRLGAEYLNKTENSFICLDSSGKFWADREKKHARKKLNSVLVIPPIEKGQSPFPIFEQISESNKTIDFIGLLQYAYHYMGISINNQEVKKPAILISDLSFANIHAVLDVFNKVKIKEYLKTSFRSLTKKEELPFDTVLTICESHLLPAILKSVRATHVNKVLADTVTAGLLVMLRAEDFEVAYEVWKNLVKVHGSKVPDVVAQESVKHYSMKGVDTIEDAEVDFSDVDDAEEVVKYGKREAIRANSPFFNLFRGVLDKVVNEEENIRTVTNPFYCPDLLQLICKQYLSLFPLISASVLPGENIGLRNNAYVELYWQELRRIFASIPKRQLWPPQYLGMLHEDIQRKATEIILRKFIPNLRTGGSAHQKAVTFADTLGDDDQLNKKRRPGTKPTNLFKPKPSKKKKAEKPKESFNESFETWMKKDRVTVKRKSSTYMKDKVIDYASIEEDNFPTKRKSVAVSGPGAAKGKIPQIINISDAELSSILMKNHNIDNEVIDAGLSLIDRKLNEDCRYVEGVTVYNFTSLRLILAGVDNLVKDGYFVAIFPRRFALEEEAEQIFAGTGEKREVDIGHFALVSNIRCQEGEVRAYETLPAYRNPKFLLTEEQKKVLRKLTKIQDEKMLRVDCIDVCPQKEQECGAISFGLAVQLCFTFPKERSLFASFVDVRRDFVECLKADNLVEFETLKRDVTSDVLFSINI